MLSEETIRDLYLQAYGEVMEDHRVYRNGTPYYYHEVTDYSTHKIKIRFARLLEEHIRKEYDTVHS